ncbi:MAG: IS110 family transposase [Bosea sp. (in: a-proteobacteria)]|jgi:transposase|uniref:IS110 family transposase n=1 Tax=Alphaproteobacteria TaxID=28211 RepID=UPI00083692B4|nr:MULTISPECIES: IS110 family transposase [Alphaproteobacteria]MBX9912159.1 IS110 family transposase [Beijerinckiaceae bacterium]MDP3600153.1 IS110 family transposase [Bosea sp. (in: a-proteobacteria)]PZR76887.1 MAG: IS110 family transposase [Stutzerimonas stutzeri]
MMIKTIGLDLAKSIFQAHGVDERGATVLVKKLHRKQMLPFFSKLPPCLIGVEACGTAHHWARTLSAMGHEVRLIPPSYVKAFVKRGKSDALDAQAICEAVQRPTMQFVPVKTVAQQGILMTHRARSLLVRQRTSAANALRAHLAELGLVANPGVANLAKLAEQALAEDALPSFARAALVIMHRQIVVLGQEISELDRQIAAWHAESEASRRLAAIPGLGVVTATAIAATVTDPDQFRSGRQFAAWLGLTPQQQSTGGKTRLGGISKQGDRYLRRLLVVGATAVIRHTKDKPTPMASWIRTLLEKKPFRLVSVALANKLARIAWVLLTRKETYRPQQLAA